MKRIKPGGLEVDSNISAKKCLNRKIFGDKKNSSFLHFIISFLYDDDEVYFAYKSTLHLHRFVKVLERCRKSKPKNQKDFLIEKYFAETLAGKQN